jgi:hypothetical protein
VIRAQPAKKTSGGWASIVASNRPSQKSALLRSKNKNTQSLHTTTPQQQQGTTTLRGSTQHRKNTKNEQSKQMNKATKEQFLIDIQLLQHGQDHRTTLMIRNIPNKYTRQMLVDELNEYPQLLKCYDFLYLPIDFRNKCNLGYAFINMMSVQNVIELYHHFRGERWKRSRSEKKVDVKFGRLQSRAKLIEHFRASNFLARLPDDFRPIVYYSSGKQKGEIEFYIGYEEEGKGKEEGVKPLK